MDKPEKNFGKEWEIFGKGIGLDKEQVRQAVDLFEKEDADNSGQIEEGEFINLMSKQKK